MATRMLLVPIEDASDEPRAVQVTAVGSMPGTDPLEAARIVAGELDVPHVPELPARGPGADMLGRTLALICATTGEFAAQTTPTGWALTGARTGGEPGRAMRRGASWLAEDCDRLEEQLADFRGTVKAQLVGPWTLAAGLESARGTRLLADAGACVELADALAEAMTAHLAELGRRVPGATLLAQLDEPTLPAVEAGQLRTASGRGAVRTPEHAELTARLGAVVAGARRGGAVEVAAHCCARTVPFDLFGRAGIGTVSLDLAAVGGRADEQLGQWWDRGDSVILGVAPAVDPDPAALRGMPESLARAVDELWHRIGIGVGDAGERTRLSPGCGLAGASAGWARGVGGALRGAARLLESAD